MDERDLTEFEVLILKDLKINDNHQTKSSLIFKQIIYPLFYVPHLYYVYNSF